ncbi:unnamed protein product [Linum trigynum]|uniref:Uncharacterized protein n=1 Tax=Linum trigynum TaxID=586398 RepID=A0AAV2D5T9_9ROSI
MFVMRKQRRESPAEVTPLLTITSWMAPFTTRVPVLAANNGLQGRALYCISKAFTTAASKLEKIGWRYSNSRG